MTVGVPFVIFPPSVLIININPRFYSLFVQMLNVYCLHAVRACNM